ncbi:sugar ABC transporter ATP-binding protein [Actinocatenispora rupis]|uniref:Sugar ABC transporter ATP-binding protein n=1 Tax=Actinocatenispora rupis TaxID=519421 RepID=A0A8J3ND91_9ACTN|nr:sugar ABC transporter ATP-binding protein [Actinocatenispora rupis]GID11249.1 sugar ABC transporter ATP-binding protein [Actinocatenispora rupis]
MSGDPGRPAPPYVIEGVGLSQSFGHTRALTDVSLAIQPGECLGLVGRNGAGKSTVVSILSGLRRPDTGVVRLGGEPAPPVGDPAAWRRRVATVHQHSMLVPTLTVAENMYLDRQPRRTGLGRVLPGPLHWSAMRTGAAEVLREWGVDVDVTAPAGAISVEQRQIVEIARALSTGTRCLILDEPTAALERAGVRRLFGRLRPLLAQGVGILYISHHLEEVYEICDRVTVLRDGRHVRTGAVGGIGQDELVTAMVGPEDPLAGTTTIDAAPTPDPDAAPVLAVRHLTAADARGSLTDVSLVVRPGECVGVLGLAGSGTTTLADAVAGLVRPTAGAVLVAGVPLPAGRPDVALRHGIGYVPEDRHARGYVPMLGVGDNITMTITDRLTRYGVLSPRRHLAAARRLAERLGVVSAGTAQPVVELSGGNQQKVVVGRALARDPRVVVAVAPTQGVDVASKRALLGALDEVRGAGAGVLLVSDDLADLAIANRIVVLVRGRTFAEFVEPPWDREALIAASEGLGARDDDPPGTGITGGDTAAGDTTSGSTASGGGMGGTTGASAAGGTTGASAAGGTTGDSAAGGTTGDSAARGGTDEGGAAQ